MSVEFDTLERTAGEAGEVAPDDRSVIGRAFRVLAALGEDATTVSLARLAERTGLPKGSLHRLCAQLIDQGVVERVGVGYRLGFRMYDLGMRASSPRDLRNIALPLVSELHAVTKCAAHLSVLKDDDLFIVNAVTGRSGLRYALVPGGRRRALETASGRALVAMAAPEVRERILRNVYCPPGLRAEMDRVAAEGVSRLRVDNKLQALAVPVMGWEGYSVAALSLCCADFPARHDDFINALRGAARVLEAKLKEVPGSVWYTSNK